MATPCPARRSRVTAEIGPAKSPDRRAPAVKADPFPVVGPARDAVQAQQISEEIAALGFAVEVIADSLGRPVAVRIPHVLPEDEAAKIVDAATITGQDVATVKDVPFVSDVLPYGTRSGRVYSSGVCDVLDATVRAVSRRSSVSAFHLAAPEGGTTIGLGDAGPHTDFPASLENPPAAAIHGLNVHLALQGSATARFGHIGSFGQVERIAQVLTSARQAGLTAAEINGTFGEIYASHMELAAEPVRHVAGDVLIFQARPHRSKGLLPVIHHFVSESETRWHVAFRPQAGNQDDVRARRHSLISRCRLQLLGYRTGG